VETGPPPQEPRQRSGFLTFLYLLLGLGAVLALVGGIALYVFFRSEQGQRVLELAREGSELLIEASQAPGTDELRGAGCEQALVARAGRILDLVRRFDPEGAAFGDGGEAMDLGSLEGETPVVVCTQKAGSAGTPDCETAARLYASAQAAQPDRFVVLMVTRQESLAGCSGIYGPDGTRLADLPQASEEAPEAGSADEAPGAGSPDDAPSAAAPAAGVPRAA